MLEQIDTVPRSSSHLSERFQHGQQISKSLNIELVTLLTNAQTLIKHKEYEAALNLIRQAGNQDSNNNVVLKTHARILRFLKKYNEELRIRIEILKHEYNFENIVLKGECYYFMDNDPEAQLCFFEAMSILSSDSEMLFDLYRQLGNILVRQGDMDGAEEYYNKAYARNPNSDTLLVNLGTLELQKGDLERALYCFRKAIEMNNQNDKGWIGLGMVHRTYGDFELAWANVKRAIEINPNNRTGVLLLANWGSAENNYAYPIEVMQQYLSREQYDSEIALILINFFCHTGKLTKAKIEIERFLLWNPENDEVLGLKAKLKDTKI